MTSARSGDRRGGQADGAQRELPAGDLDDFADLDMRAELEPGGLGMVGDPGQVLLEDFPVKDERWRGQILFGEAAEVALGDPGLEFGAIFGQIWRRGR